METSATSPARTGKNSAAGETRRSLPTERMDGVMNKIIYKLKCTRGAVEMTSLVLMSWLVIMLMLAGVDIFLMASRFITVSNVTQSALEMMKDEGGLTKGGDLSIEQWFIDELAERGVPAEDVRIVAATEPTVMRGDTLRLHVQARYLLRSFRPLGMSSEQLTATWNIEKTGISRRFIRTL